MQIILLILTLTVGIGAYFLYPRFPWMMRLITGCLLLLCVGTISTLLFSPSDLMEHAPSHLATILHPWVLGLMTIASGVLFLACAIGSLAGCLTTRLHRQNQEGEQGVTPNA
jgi:hypothetical protein